MKDKEKQIEEMAKDYYGYSIDLEDDCKFVAEEMYNKGYRKISENEVVIDKNENPCLSCPVPEDIQRDVDCSTICGAVRLGIDWQNQCKVLVKENKQLTKELAQARKETAEKIFNTIIKALETKKASIITHYGIKESVGADVAIRTVKNLAKQFGVEIKE